VKFHWSIAGVACMSAGLVVSTHRERWWLVALDLICITIVVSCEVHDRRRAETLLERAEQLLRIGQK
jgi:hypothetical protein